MPVTQLIDLRLSVGAATVSTVDDVCVMGGSSCPRALALPPSVQKASASGGLRPQTHYWGYFPPGPHWGASDPQIPNCIKWQ